jgi:hypothetical protein
MSRAVQQILRDGARAAAPAAVLSGLPSTLYLLLTKRDPVKASLAAGSILLPNERKRGPLLIAAAPVHFSPSAAWGAVLAAALPRKKPVVEGIVAGLLTATLDLGIIGRRFRRVRSLAVAPQVTDHVAFGILAAIAFTRRDR